MGLPGWRSHAGGASVPHSAWLFDHAYLRADVAEDVVMLAGNVDAGCDDVAWLGFRAAGSRMASVHARYEGVHHWEKSPDDFSGSTIYQNPLGDDSMWEADTHGNPLNKARQTAGYGLSVILEDDAGSIPRPLQEGRVVETDHATYKESTIKMPLRVVFELSGSPSPGKMNPSDDPGNSAVYGDGQGMDRATGESRLKYVLGKELSNPYRFYSRRTYHLCTVNRVSNTGACVPGVRLKLSQDRSGGNVETNVFPGPADKGFYYDAAGNQVEYFFGSEINTDISPEGTIRLQNHGSFPSWDNIRVIVPAGEYQTPVIDAGTSNVLWGTIAWTLTIPATADPVKERIAFEPKTFAARDQAGQHGLDDWSTDGYYFVQGGYLDGNKVGAGFPAGYRKGRIKTSGSPVVESYDGMNGAGQPTCTPAGARHGQRYLLLKAWLTSERTAAYYNPSALVRDPMQDPDWGDDAQWLKETPVLEDVTVTYLPPVRVSAYHESVNP